MIKKRYSIIFFHHPNQSFVPRYNIGEVLFRESLFRFVSKHYPHLEYVPEEKDLSQGDYYIVLVSTCLDRHDLGCLPHVQTITYPLQRREVNIIFLGIGIASAADVMIPRANERVLRTFVTEGKSIGVRGTFTSQLLTRYGIPNRILGCPSVLLGHDNETILKKYMTRGAIPKKFGFQSTLYSALDEGSILLDLYSLQYDGVSFPQTEWFWIEEKEKGFCKDDHNSKTIWLEKAHRVLGNKNQEIHELYQKMVQSTRIITSIDHWLEEMSQLDFLLTSRIHGAIAALSAGVPVMVIAHDMRVLELCRTLKIPYTETLDISKPLLFYYQRANCLPYYKNLEAVAKGYIDFLSEHGLCIPSASIDEDKRV